MARLPYLDAEQLPPEQRELLKRPINLTRLLVNSPGMARAFGGIGNYIRHKSSLDPRLRELAILQVGWLEKSEYEITQHLSNEHMTDLVLTIAFYCAVVRVLATMKIDNEPYYKEVLQQYPLS